jgi:hypothetical protein
MSITRILQQADLDLKNKLRTAINLKVLKHTPYMLVKVVSYKLSDDGSDVMEAFEGNVVRTKEIPVDDREDAWVEMEHSIMEYLNIYDCYSLTINEVRNTKKTKR